MENLKKLMTIVALCFTTCTLWGQNVVSLVVTGEGKDKEEATFKALRSAIEQAYGTFVSANTTVLNDQLVADEIVSLSSGNIQKYEYVSENKMPDGSTFVTLSATVSIDKLVSFAESKGMEAELKGSLFAMNIKKMEFDKKAEEKAVENLCKQLEAMLPSMFSYVIEVNEPKINQNNPDYCDVGVSVGVISTDAFLSFCSVLCNTISQIALGKDELEKYQSLNAKTYNTPIMNGPLYYVCNEELKKTRNYILYNPASHSSSVYEIVNESEKIISGDTCEFFRVKKIYDVWNLKMRYGHGQDELFIFRDFSFRSDTSITMIRDLYTKLYKYAYNFILDDGLHEMEFSISDLTATNVRHYTENEEDAYNYHDLKSRNGPELWNNIFYPALHSPYSIATSHYIYGNPLSYYYSEEYEFVKNNRFCTVWDTLHYPLSEISKISNITVRKPIYTEENQNELMPKESKKTSSNITEKDNTRSIFSVYSDTLRNAVNSYNALLKQYPYNYQEKSLSYSLPQEYDEQDGLLRDTLHVLLAIISEETKQLKEQYKIDSLEYHQLNGRYQLKLEEVNQELLEDPYNSKKKTITDVLPMTLFGKSKELKEEMQKRLRTLPEKQEQIEQEVRSEIRSNNPQQYVSIYYSRFANKNTEADSMFLECRCNFHDRLSFDLAFVDNTLYSCSCRQLKYDEVKHLFHSREEFDQSYNQPEEVFNQEIAERRRMMEYKTNVEETLLNIKQLNFKKARNSSNEEMKMLLRKIDVQKGKYYYTDVIELIFVYNERLAKEWAKNGTYFKSKTEMFENYIGEDYDKVLKERKKE